MPEWVWIVIVAGAVPVIGVLVWRLARVGGQIAIGKSTFVLHGEPKQTDSPLGRALRSVPENIGQIHSYLYGQYLRLIKEKGVDPAGMTDIEDARFAKVVLLTSTSLGNGSWSVQKILEHDIASQDWNGSDLDDHIRDRVLPRITEAVRSVRLDGALRRVLDSGPDHQPGRVRRHADE
jgi:hypothetical protein